MKFSKEEVLKILEGAKDEQGNVPFAIVKKAIEKLRVESEWIPVAVRLPESSYEAKHLINELSKMSPMVIATAYSHAINYTMYGVDVTEKWLTATQNANALEKAYQKGYYDALQRRAENEDKE